MDSCYRISFFSGTRRQYTLGQFAFHPMPFTLQRDRTIATWARVVMGHTNKNQADRPAPDMISSLHCRQHQAYPGEPGFTPSCYPLVT